MVSIRIAANGTALVMTLKMSLFRRLSTAKTVAYPSCVQCRARALTPVAVARFWDALGYPRSYARYSADLARIFEEFVNIVIFGRRACNDTWLKRELLRLVHLVQRRIDSGERSGLSEQTPAARRGVRGR